MSPTAPAPAPTLEQLRPAQIAAHPANPRTDVGDVTELADSIRGVGILEPLIVAPATDRAGEPVPGKYLLIAGHRRLAAARAVKLKAVPAIVRHALAGDPAAQLQAMLVENLQRVDLTPIEEGTAYQALLEFPGWTQAKISAATGRSRATVRSRVGMAALPKSARTRIHTGQITLEEASELVRYAADPAALAKLEKAAGTGHWTWQLAQVRSDTAKAKAITKHRATLTETHPGVPVLEGLPQGWRWSDDGPRMLADLGLDATAHADCPGHALVIEATASYRSGRTVYTAEAVPVCTTPDAHGEPDTDPAALAAAAARAEQKATEAALFEGLALASALRRDHLAGCVAAGTGAHALALAAARAVVTSNRRGHGHALAVHLLGLPEDSDTAAVESALDALDLASLVVFADLLRSETSERDLTERLYAWGPQSWARGYLARLTEVYGWAWTFGEQAVIDTLAAETAEVEAAALAAEEAADDIADHREDVDCPDPGRCVDPDHYAVA